MSIDIANSRGSLRFLVLAFGCIAFFADYYCQDIPGVMRNQFLENFGKDSERQPEYLFDLLYSVYSLPNVLLPFIAGMLVDQFGYRLMNIVFCALVMLGQVLLYVGATANNASWMIFSRFVFGLGGESLSVTTGILLVNSFKGNELSFSQGFNLSFARLGSVLNCLISPRLAKASFDSPIRFACGVAAISVVGAILVSVIDKRYETMHPKITNQQNNESSQETLETFDSIRKFSKSFWIVTGLACSLYLTVIPFNMIASGFFEDAWLKSSVDDELERNRIAGQFMSIIMIVSSALFPVVGLLVDKYGQRLRFLMVASFMAMFSHLLFLKIYPIAPLIILGAAYGIFGGVLWPTVVFLVPKDKLGAAYGLIQSIQNLVLGLCPMIIGILKTRSGSYVSVILLFAVFGKISIFLSYLLMAEDKNHKTSLNSNDQTALLSYVEEQDYVHVNSKIERKSQSDRNESTDDEENDPFVIRP